MSNFFGDIAKELAKNVFKKAISGDGKSSSSSGSSTTVNYDDGDFLMGKAREAKIDRSADEIKTDALKSVNPAKEIDSWIELLSTYEKATK